MTQVIANGLVQGSIFALAAMGLSLVFGVVRVPHFAHGETLMLGGMVALSTVTGLGLPLGLALITGSLAAVGLGLVMGLCVFYPMRKLPELNHLIAAVALVFMIEAAAAKIWGDAPKLIPGGPAGIVDFLGARVSTMRIIIIVVALGLAIALHLFVERTRAGMAMKGMALNPKAALLMGIPVFRYWALAFAIGSLLAGIAGVLLGTVLPVQAAMGSVLALKAFVVVIFAGLGSIGGAYIGGVILGLVEAFSGSYISSGYINAYSFLFLLLVLLIKPDGLFGLGRTHD